VGGVTCRRRLVAEKARRVRNGTLLVVGILVLLALLLQLVAPGTGSGTRQRVWQDLLEVAVIVALLAQALRASARTAESLHQPEVTPLPRWGRAARLIFRWSATTAVFTFLAGWGLIVLANMDGADGLLSISPWFGAIVALGLLVPSVAVLTSGVLWAAVEAWLGYREPAPRR
jgi:hypothetical protein